MVGRGWNVTCLLVLGCCVPGIASETYEAAGAMEMPYDSVGYGGTPYAETAYSQGPYTESPVPYGEMPYAELPTVGDDYFNAAMYDAPTVKFTFDGYLFTRVGGETEQPLILESVFPSNPSLTSGDLSFEGRIGGRAELTFYAKPGGYAPHASILWTGTELSKAERTGDPADILFFNATAAEPSDGYTARNRSRFIFGDVGIRKTVSHTYGWSAGLAYGRLVESLDLISAPDDSSAPSLSGPSERGFYSQVENEMIGFQLGLDAQIWTNGRSKIEGGITGGIFHNDISVGAQAENAAQDWSSAETMFVGGATLSFVIPADPVNFRFGYQGFYLSDVALPVSQSRDRSIISGAGEEPTDEVWYHGFLFGIELLR